MGFFSWVILGLIAGMLAKILSPGKDGGGFIKTTILGVLGAFVGGYLGSFFNIGSTSEFSFESIGTATAGAFLILFVYKAIFNKKK